MVSSSSRKAIGAGFCVGFFILMAACASEKLEQARQITPQGTAFNRSLASGYLQLAEHSDQEGNDQQAENYAQKSLSSAQGSAPPPDNPVDYDLANQKQDELQKARLRLMSLLESNATVEMPVESAQAQTKFDCWLDRASRNELTTPECHAGFEKSLQEATLKGKNSHTIALNYDLARDTTPYNKEAQPLTSQNLKATSSKKIDDARKSSGKYTKGVPFEPAKWGTPAKTFTLYFNSNSSIVTEEGLIVLDDVIAHLMASPYKMIRIEGYTDLKGTETANLALSFKRAVATDHALLKALKEKKTPRSLEGKGERNPVIDGQAGFSAAKNRRVEIMLF
jgi:outer membrane protein OmpA-like peptidoglycan-associated protein